MSRGARILSTALITAGLVVLLDVGLTLSWKEPVSSVYGWLQQQQAEDELTDLEADTPSAADLAALRGVPIGPERAKVLAKRFKKELQTGRAIGRLKIDRVDLNIVVVEGTDTASLQKGPGHYEDTPLPGEGETSAIAGHRTTYLAPFHDIERIKKDDEVIVQMPYATFTYRVEKHEIVDPGQVEILEPAGYERLVLTACHPLYSAAQRYVVFAKVQSIELPSEVQQAP